MQGQFVQGLIVRPPLFLIIMTDLVGRGIQLPPQSPLSGLCYLEAKTLIRLSFFVLGCTKNSDLDNLANTPDTD